MQEAREEVLMKHRERRVLRRGLAESEGTGLSVPGDECRFAHVEVPGVSVASEGLLPRLLHVCLPACSKKAAFTTSKCGRLFFILLVPESSADGSSEPSAG